ncbi:MAG: hypothetical protein K0S38_999 [Candidatus Paceibacter sp.]|jgi:hypothetical protein|nr:hypothetical protein [Candidatus Paceibacter sp.]
MEKFSWNKVTWYSQVLAVVLFVGVFYIGFSLGEQSARDTKDMESPLVTLADTNNATGSNADHGVDLISEADFTCAASKTLHVHYYPNRVSLKSNDDRTIELAQTASPTGGARYANKEETIAFLNKGNSAYLWEAGKTTFADCYTK